MKVGLIGYSGSGKTTVFRAVTGLMVGGGHAGGRLKPNLGVTKVPDKRVDELTKLYKPRKVVYAEITFVDVPGGAPERGSGSLDPAMVEHIGDMDALALVVRGFDSMTLGLPPADPIKELAGMAEELVLHDYMLMERRAERLVKDISTSKRHLDVVERCRHHLDQGHPLRTLELSEDDIKELSSYRLLSRKQVIGVLNVDEESINSPLPSGLRQAAESVHLASVIQMSADLEAEIAALEPEEQREFLADLGMDQSARDRFIQATYETLDLISFLTVGTDEVRAWPIRRGTTAVRAARTVHSDIERGFIRAEVIRYDDLIKYGSESQCRSAGKLRTEGKTYVVQDGDVINYLFNV